MPISDFKWLKKSWNREEILNYNPEGAFGHFLEVDISTPEQLHDKFNCYPIMPEPLDITKKLASPKSLEIRRKRYSDLENLKKRQGNSDSEKLKQQTFSSIKLAPNLFPKQKYICHIRNLQFYLQQGAILHKVHRVLSFKQVIPIKNDN